jgi:hypothetical protein
MLQTVLEPVVFRCKPYQDAGRTAVPRDDDLFVGSLVLPRSTAFHLTSKW